MDVFLLELRDLDETQERVEAVSDEMLKAQSAGDTARMKAMVDHWINALRTSDFQSERVAFLYVANHVLQKTLYGENQPETPHFVGFFLHHLEEAVSLVSNSPMDRQNVIRLLELWHEKEVFPNEEILKLWKCTGEDLPDFLLKAADSTASEPINVDHIEEAADVELPHTHLPALPVKLNAHSANPVLNVLKKMDHHKAAIQYLDDKILERQQFLSVQASTRYQTPEDLVADHTITPSQLKQRVEECLRMVQVRNNLMREIPVLKEQLADAIMKMKTDEELAGSKIEQKLEQCDLIDIGLADLVEHRTTYAEEWEKESSICSERRRKREEEQRQKEEEMARLHQEAIAESAAHAMHLEADINAGTTTELQSLSKEIGNGSKEPESKPEETNEMVWHPVLRELVPLQSLNLEWEDWRDH